MINRYYKFFGLVELNPEAKRFVFKAYNLFFGMNFLFLFTNTFFVLFALEKVTFAELGIILAVQLFVQSIIDYPTGAVGDWIGQKWILGSATVFYSVGYILFGSATDFTSLLIAYLFMALAQAQQSGAWGAWLDNNYKLYAPEDDKRKIYMESTGKFQMVNQFLWAAAFIIGGIIVSMLGRSLTFILQGIAIGLFTLVILFSVEDHPELERKEPDMKSYVKLLGEGVTVSFGNPTLRLLIIGTTISAAALIFWGNFILFPLYESYAKTDEMVGMLRAAIYLSGALILGLVASHIKRIKNTQFYLALSVVITDVLFFWGVYCVINIFPAQEEFSIVSVLILIISFIILGSPRNLQNILMPRFYLDVIPSKNRNSIYSLMPTVVMICSVLTTLYGGFMIDALGTNTMIILVGAVSLAGSLVTAKAVLSHTFETDKLPSDVLVEVSESGQESPQASSG